MVSTNLHYPFPPPLTTTAATMQMSVNFTSLRSYFFISFQQVTSKVDNFTTDFKVFFSSCVEGFSLTEPSQKLKKPCHSWRGLFVNFHFLLWGQNCQIESDVCVCCKRDSKPLHWLSIHEQKTKVKIEIDFTLVGIFKRQARTKLI